MLHDFRWFSMDVLPCKQGHHFQLRSCAGADRLSSGMRGAFGKPYGTAARVDIGQVLISLRTKERLVKCSLGNDGTVYTIMICFSYVFHVLVW